MRTPIISGNWKMNTTLAQALALVGEMKERLPQTGGVETVLCPPFISLAAIKDLLQDTDIWLGAQNMYFEDKGAYTGEVAPPMLAELCQWVILGHSERRQFFQESDEVVNSKVRAAFRVGLKPILCVGERLEENEAGRTLEVITRQLKGGLQGLDTPYGLVVAYEPIWAIGTGRAATGGEANATVGAIRTVVASLYGDQFAQGLRLQYGGSVTADNITEFIQEPEIDGALVGGASLKADDFVSIVQQASALKKA
jgi:triosephosphate isomerase